MGLVTFRPGESFENLTRPELEQSLRAQYEMTREEKLRGVKDGDCNINVGVIGASQLVYSTPGTSPYGPAAGFVWAVMNIGIEVAANGNVRLYKQVPALGTGSAPTGSGRYIGLIGTPGSSGIVANLTMPKGMCTLKNGDQLTLVSPTAGAFLLSIFISYIQVPAEKRGELYI
jgi:hypothetical protein